MCKSTAERATVGWRLIMLDPKAPNHYKATTHHFFFNNDNFKNQVLNAKICNIIWAFQKHICTFSEDITPEVHSSTAKITGMKSICHTFPVPQPPSAKLRQRTGKGPTPLHSSKHIAIAWQDPDSPRRPAC